MFNSFIQRPVLATAISIILVMLGIISLIKLPLERFPDIAPPSVLVRAVYPGANAETILRSVAPSLEEAINGVENMSYISSTASNDGTLRVSVYFKQGTDPDLAAINVQNRVSQAMSQLPPEVVQQGIVTSKQLNTYILNIALSTLDEKKYDQTFLTNYALINVVPELKRITGVGEASVFGAMNDYAMRVWLNPAQMQAHNITPTEVMAIIRKKNLEAAPGRFGEGSHAAFEYVMKYKGKYNKPEDYQNIILRSDPNGSILRLKDVARVELGSYAYNSMTRVNSKKSVILTVYRLAGSNAIEIQKEVDRIMEKTIKNLPAEIKADLIYNTKVLLDQSITQVKHTLIEAFILVFLVVYLFLQDFRSTLIPAIAVPVAIIGTFFFMLMFGFTINLLTLFALVLSIGIVVDDAIVVVEAVHAKMEHTALGAREATVKTMKEISGAIVSITLVMAAVFLPVGFISGSTGIFYRQFAFTMAIAIIISAINALTLSPALAALILKNPHNDPSGEKPKTSYKLRFFKAFNRSFSSLTEKYTGGIKFLIKHKFVSLLGLGILTIATIWMMRTAKTGFIPTEDQGFIAIAVSTPVGTSLEQTSKVMEEAEAVIAKMDATIYSVGLSGMDMLTQSASSSSSILFCRTKEEKERGEVKDINDIMTQIRQNLGKIKGATFFVFTFPTVPGFNFVESLDLVLQDKTGGSLDNFSKVANTFIEDLKKDPSIDLAFTSFKADYPQFLLEIDEEKADQLGVEVEDILQTMRAYFGSAQVSDFNRFGKYYRVIAQADMEDRKDPSAINNVAIRNKQGRMVPISSIIHLKKVFGPETASRFNLFNSISVNALPKKGHSTGEAIKAVQEIADKKLPYGFTFEFTGQTREEISSSGQSTIIFILCLLFVYFLLSAQYESYVLPLAVLLSIPTGLFGVFLTIGLKGIENNIYVQVALIMLIGLLAKNAILIIEFALQRRRNGQPLISAAIEASRMRLRPIIMTSVAFVFGLIPMTFATGPSAQGNHSISISSAGGMISGVILGVLIIPVLFVVFQSLHEKIVGAHYPVK